MSTIFVTRPGYAVRLSEDIPTGNIIEIGGGVNNLTSSGSGAFDTYKAIVTGITMDYGGGVQVTHSLQSLIYAYSFGERLGDINISGLAFNRVCGDAENSVSGAEQLLRYYEETRVTRLGKLIPITIGTSVHGRLRGFLTNIRLGLSNPEIQLTDFVLRFRGFRG